MLFLKNNNSISLVPYELVKLFIIFCFSMHYGNAQQNICEGSFTYYKVDETENGGNGTIGSSYQWTVANPLFQGVINFTSLPNTNAISINWLNTPPGNYTLNVVETNVQQCTSAQNLQITIFAKPKISLLDQVVCVSPITGQFLNPVILYSGLSSSQYTFQWFQNNVLIANSPNLAVDTSASYTLTATHILSGCSTSATVNVVTSSAPVASIIVNQPFADSQTIHVILESGYGDYEYAINNGYFQDTPYFEVQDPGQYHITVRDKKFCGETTLIAHVINYPKYFTPNNDGNNDFWNIIGLPQSYKAIVSIFDRYGKLLYQFNPKSANWDGNYNNNPLPSTDYWFTIDYYDDSNEHFSFKSHFSLIR